MFKIKLYAWLAALMILSLALAACGPAATPQPTQAALDTSAPADTAAPQATVTEAPQSQVTLPNVDPAQFDGNIIVAGSSTVFPLTERMAEIFNDDGFTGNVTIDSIGTGAGFERFCVSGESDISNASRAIRDTEIASCQAIGREPVEFRVGTDALAIVVSTDNDFLDSVTTAELAAIYSSDAVKWSDVNAAWPAEDIQRFSPGTDSGTFDYFIEVVMTPALDDDATDDVNEGEASLLDADNLQLSEDDNVLAQGVTGSPYAIGYFGYAYYQENASSLKVLTIDGIEPTVASVDAAEYPLSRPLFIYSDATVMKDKPQVAAFINYFLTYVDDEIRDVGYFPANRDALNSARQAWIDATGQAAQ
jgi:phosphate transport system substrate-binding protein